MPKSFRRIIACLLTVIFVMIIMGPLAPLAMRSPAMATVASGECSGDCATCGCSLERSATRTCCCWQKKARLQEEEQEQVQNMSSCCKPQKTLHKKSQKKVVSIKSHCPCERNKLNAVFGSTEPPLLTSRIVVMMPVYTEHRLPLLFHKPMPERQDEPPDPPPEAFPTFPT